MKAKIISSLLLSSILLLSCTPNVVATPTATEQSVTLSSTQVQPTIAATTGTVVPTSTLSNMPARIPVCARGGIPIPVPANFGIPGTIIYQKDYYGLYTLGGNPLSYSKLPVDEEQKYSTFGFSPDGNWFAFSPIEYSSTNDIIFDVANIILFSANGERKETTLSIEDFVDEPPAGFRFVGFSDYSYWINNTKIYAALYSGIKSSDDTWSFDDSAFKVLDPFVGSWWEKPIPEDMPQFEKGISPDMTRMLYLEDGLLLKDLDKGVDIWQAKDLFTAFHMLMLWSPDSKTVAYANILEAPEYSNVVLISRDGMAKSIMGPSTSLPGLIVKDLQWSPDGRSLAVLVQEGKEKGDSVYIYDVATESFVSQCPIANSMDIQPKIFWSPDNKYLAYSAREYPLIIMNIASGETFQLADNGRVVGWSAKFPVIWSER